MIILTPSSCQCSPKNSAAGGARSMRTSFRHDNDVPFYAYQTERCPLLCLPNGTMSPFMLIIFGGNDVPFYAYRLLKSPFMLIREWKKLQFEFTQNRVFFRSGLSGLSFRSRQNTQCHLLGLSVLIYHPQIGGKFTATPGRLTNIFYGCLH